MTILFTGNLATGSPGMDPRWTRSDKDGVGCAYSALSRVWFTVSKGFLNEVYYPTIDRPQIRDLQYLGSCWRRYNHDGYGQREDARPYQGWGYGHAWPVLTGERGHYEVAA
jgi:glucoamylase